MVCHLLLDSRTVGRHIALVCLIAWACTASAGIQSDSSHKEYICNADTARQGKVKCAEWYPNGELHIVKRFRNGLRHGTWSYYGTGGMLEKKVRFKKGRRILELYYEDDDLYKTIDKNGKVRFRKKCDCL